MYFKQELVIFNNNVHYIIFVIKWYLRQIKCYVITNIKITKYLVLKIYACFVATTLLLYSGNMIYKITTIYLSKK